MKLMTYCSVIGAFLLIVISGTAQQLNFAPVSPYQEFKAHHISMDDAGMLHMVSPFQDEVYSSMDGESWSKVIIPDLEDINSLHYFSNGELALATNDSLYVKEGSTWNLVFETSEHVDGISVFIKNDVIYIYDRGTIHVSTNQGVTFAEVYNEPDAEFLDAKLFVTNQFIYFYSNNSITTLSQTYQFIKNREFARQGFILNLAFLHISDDDILVYGNNQIDGAIEPTLSGAAFYSVDQGDSFKLIASGDCQEFNGGIVIGEDIFVSEQSHDLHSININSQESETVRIDASGQFLHNTNKTYIYNAYSINELLDHNTGEVSIIESNLTFVLQEMTDFKVSRDGQLYLLNEYNLFHSSDGGLSWNKLDTKNQEVLNFDVGTDNRLHILTPSQYYLSDDAGQTLIGQEHDLLTFFSVFQNIVSNPTIVSYADSTVFMRHRGCQGLTNGSTSVSQNLGPFFQLQGFSFGLSHPNFIKLGSDIYGFGNKRWQTGAAFARMESDFSHTIINDDVPRQCLVIDENLIHYNDGFSYVSTDLGVTAENLGLGPEGDLHKAQGYEGTYIHKITRLFNRPLIDEAYE